MPSDGKAVRVARQQPVPHGAGPTRTRATRREEKEDGDAVPTIQQLVRKGRQDKVAKTTTPALKGSPQKRGPSGQKGVMPASLRSVHGGWMYWPRSGCTRRSCCTSSSDARQISSCAV